MKKLAYWMFAVSFPFLMIGTALYADQLGGGSKYGLVEGGFGGTMSSGTDLDLNGNNLLMDGTNKVINADNGLDSPNLQFTAGFVNNGTFGTNRIEIAGQSSRIELASGVDLLWSASATTGGTRDVGLERVSDSLLAITDGSTGRGNLELGEAGATFTISNTAGAPVTTPSDGSIHVDSGAGDASAAIYVMIGGAWTAINGL